MEDRYLFRGKDINDGEWIYGNLIEKVSQYSAKDKTKIRLMCIAETGKDGNGFVNHYNEVQINPDTVGQCTGLKDKNGNLIFEGDIIKSSVSLHADNDWNNWIVRWNNNEYGTTGFAMVLNNASFPSEMCVGHSNKYEIIGNIHDNPERLKRSSPTI